MGGYPEAVIFEERDGFFWVGERDFPRIEESRGARYDCSAVGFDKQEAMAHALALMARGLKVGLRRGDTVRMLSRPPKRLARKPETTPVFLAPALLFDRSTLQRFAHSVSRQHSRLRVCFDRWRFFLSSGEKDTPTIYVMRLADSMYEVDWQHTELSEESLHGLALAADSMGVRLSCRLVSGKHAIGRRRLTTPKVVVYGQLHLTL